MVANRADLSVLVIPAMAFDDTAFCQQLTQFAAQSNADKSTAPDMLNRDGDMVVDCARKTVRFEKSVAFSYSELGDTWQASRAARVELGLLPEPGVDPDLCQWLEGVDDGAHGRR